MIDVLAALLCVPAAEPELLEQLAEQSSTQRTDSLRRWIISALADDDCIATAGVVSCDGGGYYVDLHEPERVRVGFFVVMRESDHDIIRSTAYKCNIDHLVLLCCTRDVERQLDANKAPEIDSTIVGALWSAAILIENVRPMFWGLRPDTVATDAAHALSSYYTEDRPAVVSNVSLGRSKDNYAAALALTEIGSLEDQINTITSQAASEGTTLLATTFLPPVTHSPDAVRRFHSRFGASDEMLELISQKISAQNELWERQVASRQRFDLLDRHAIEEYLASPEYYQMSLTTSELMQQVERFVQLLEHPRYEVCLSPEAVNVPFQIRGRSGVQIRSDRRNKGVPRPGRIESLTLEGRDFVRSFEREFWALYRATESEFRDKRHIAEWIRQRAIKYGGVSEVKRNVHVSYDVFLCHNSRDKSQVRELANRLSQAGLRPWLDEWCLIPGRPWQRALEAQIGTISSAAVIVGRSGLSPWSSLELDAFIREFAKRDLPVIPVILEGAEDTPELPIFLQGLHWVDFREADADPMGRLVAGIRGVLPAN